MSSAGEALGPAAPALLQVRELRKSFGGLRVTDDISFDLGAGVLTTLVEQNVREALKISDRVLVLKSGAIIREAAPGELADHAKLMELY